MDGCMLMNKKNHSDVLGAKEKKKNKYMYIDTHTHYCHFCSGAKIMQSLCASHLFRLTYKVYFFPFHT